MTKLITTNYVILFSLCLPPFTRQEITLLGKKECAHTLSCPFECLNGVKVYTSFNLERSLGIKIITTNYVIIIESVDSISRDGPDMPYM